MEAFEELFAEEEPKPNTSHAFIIRIWSEGGEQDAGQPKWRGSIQTVGSDRRLYFYDLKAIQRYIEECLPMIFSQPERTWWQNLLRKLHLYD